MQEKVLNSEILFLYDCKECNPNGDPDNENRPRMDYLKGRALVSDVRLKRYVRDYFQNQKGYPIFVSKVDDKTVDATQRLIIYLIEKFKQEKEEEKAKKLEQLLEKTIQNKQLDKKENDFILDSTNKEALLKTFIDIRLFGITLPIKGQKGSSITFTGPVQFNWGYSLNKAELIESPSITSHFAGRTKGEGEEGGAIGKDWRLYYALIVFYGRISGNSAEKTLLTNEDIKELDQALWNSIITETNTRTKLNQQPRFYLRVEYKDSETFTGDLRRYIDIDKKEGLRDVGEYELDITKLVEKLSKRKDSINKIYLKVDEDIKVKGLSELKEAFKDILEELQ